MNLDPQSALKMTWPNFINYIEGYHEGQEVGWIQARYISYYSALPVLKRTVKIKDMFDTPLELAEKEKLKTKGHRDKALAVLKRLNNGKEG